jgi:hypothetical protein
MEIKKQSHEEGLGFYACKGQPFGINEINPFLHISFDF